MISELIDSVSSISNRCLFSFQDDVFVFAKEYFSPFNPTPLKGKPIIIVGPSGVGKNTLVEAVLKKYEGVFERKISHTSRPKKNIEKSSNYYLISKEEFKKKAEAGDFVEYREIGGHMYGTCKKEL